LAPTFGDLTTTTSYATMKSMEIHQVSSPKLEKLALPITWGSSFEPNDEKQRKEAQRRVQHVGLWVFKDPTSKPSGLTFPLHFPKRIFVSRFTHIEMPW
jgi:hypothetical protein